MASRLTVAGSGTSAPPVPPPAWAADTSVTNRPEIPLSRLIPVDTEALVPVQISWAEVLQLLNPALVSPSLMGNDANAAGMVTLLVEPLSTPSAAKSVADNMLDSIPDDRSTQPM